VTVVRVAVVGTPEWSVLGLGEWGNGGGDECGEEGRAPRPFIGSEGERAAGHQRGVMRSRCSGRYGSRGGVRGRETTAAAVDPGRKTTGRGPHVSEGGDRKARWAGAGERRGGSWLGQKSEMGQSSKRNSF
jgi:hypothetical protein